MVSTYLRSTLPQDDPVSFSLSRLVRSVLEARKGIALLVAMVCMRIAMIGLEEANYPAEGL